METTLLIEDLIGRGVALVVEGENVRATPRSALTDADRLALRTYKEEVVRVLRNRKCSKPAYSSIYLKPYEALLEAAVAGSLPKHPIYLPCGMVVKQPNHFILVTADSIERMAPYETDLMQLPRDYRSFIFGLLTDLDAMQGCLTR